VVLTKVSTNVLGDSISALGLMIAFYYGLTGFACVWFYRNELTDSRRNLLMRGVLPLLGGILLLGAFIIACFQYAAPDYGNTTIGGIGGVFVIGIGSLLVGVVLMVGYSIAAPDFFRGSTLPRLSSGDLVLAQAAAESTTFRLPDSGLPGLVIAPDLSNLPEGADVLDPETGEGGTVHGGES
jgi:hypothetical protein